MEKLPQGRAKEAILMLETLKVAAQSRLKCRWVKINIYTGLSEELEGTVISAGVSEFIGHTEHVVIEDNAGRCWITIPEVVREIL
jgi:signal recognition particle GTPase